MRFMLGIEERIDEARRRLADFVGADDQDLAFVTNATAGVNTVLRSLPFQPGDEILTTDHEYNACRNAIEWIADRRGMEIAVAKIPFPIREPTEVLEAVADAVTPRTRLAVIDHVTSFSALLFPIDEIVSVLDERGIDTFVDGAHGPGMVPLDLDRLGAAYYTGNCHKWLCSPKGAGFLHVRSDRQDSIAPLNISHGLNDDRADRSRFRLLFDWTGTWDPTAYLSVPAAIDFVGGLHPGGWSGLMAANRHRVLAARAMLCDVLGDAPPAPDDMIGSMAAIGVDGGDVDEGHGSLLPLSDWLFEEHRIEVPAFLLGARGPAVFRISSHAYNTPDQYERLAAALISWRERQHPAAS